MINNIPAQGNNLKIKLNLWKKSAEIAVLIVREISVIGPGFYLVLPEV